MSIGDLSVKVEWIVILLLVIFLLWIDGKDWNNYSAKPCCQWRVLSQVIPFIEPDYFEQRSDKVIFEEISSFIVNYGSAISIEALCIEIENRTDLNEGEVRETRNLTSELTDAPVDHQWLLDTICLLYTSDAADE